LRVLQENEVTPIGATRAIKTDVRVIAATHRDLSALVASGSFREDLYFRLHVVPLALPALREHPEDIALLVNHFMQRAASRGLAAKTLDASALATLAQQPWPGNVRELEHLIYRLCAMTNRSVISSGDIAPLLSKILKPARTKSPATLVVNTHEGESIPASIEQILTSQITAYFVAHGTALPASGVYDRLLARFEKPLIAATLRATGGNQIKAADILGLNRNTLRKKMRDLGIDAKSLMQKDAA
jgi:two-component system nitrogen regulation response regulator GlnG